jgi:hypothetical protein
MFHHEALQQDYKNIFIVRVAQSNLLNSYRITQKGSKSRMYYIKVIQDWVTEQTESVSRQRKCAALNLG